MQFARNKQSVHVSVRGFTSMVNHMRYALIHVQRYSGGSFCELTSLVAYVLMYEMYSNIISC